MGLINFNDAEVIRCVELLEDKTMVKVTDMVLKEKVTYIKEYEEFCSRELIEDMDIDNIILGAERVEDTLEAMETKITRYQNYNEEVYNKFNTLLDKILKSNSVSFTGFLANIVSCDINELVYNYVTGKSFINIGAI